MYKVILKFINKNYTILHNILAFDTIGSMCNTPVKAIDEQNIVDTQESNNTLHNVTDPNTSPASSLDHEGLINA